MTFATERRTSDIDASDLELPEHKLSERLGIGIVLSLVIALGVAMVVDQPVGWFAVGVVVFAFVVALVLRWMEGKGRY